MNDLESKLRSLSFRPPPPGWRAAIVAEPASLRNGWRLWLAPHPAAWGALAALWLVLGVASEMLEGPSPNRSVATTPGRPDPFSDPTLLAFHFGRQAVLP